MEPAEAGVIHWSGVEHRPLEKTADWFWALGIVALGAAATSIILGNVLFGILILAAGFAMGAIAMRAPEEIQFALDARSLFVGDARYMADEMYAFWVTGSGDDALLLVDTPRLMAPDLVIPLDGVNPELVRAWFLEHQVPEKELHESLALKVLELFGF